MRLKQIILFPIRKSFTLPILAPVLAGLLKKRPGSRLLRGICPNHTFFSKHAIKTVSRGGLTFELRLNDYMDWLLYFHSDADSATPILSYIKKDSIVLDVGGNIGQTALLIAKEVGPNGRVISFEPFPETHKRFVRNLKLNPAIQNVTLENLALGDKHDSLKMGTENKGNSGENRILDDNTIADTSIDVEVVPLSSYIEGNPLPKIDVIKIDVEGFEYRALKGATDVLRKYKPLLYIELSDKNLGQQNTSVKEVISLLHQLSYTVTDVKTGKQLNQLYSGHTDVICNPV